MGACTSSSQDNSNIFKIGQDSLEINLTRLEHGVELSQIKSNAKDLLNKSSYLFELSILSTNDSKTTQISSLDNWSSIQIDKSANNLEISFSKPRLAALPDSLVVKFLIKTNNSKSRWDISVKGLGSEHSLINAKTTKFMFQEMPNDNFFIPKFSGKLLTNPLAENVDIELLYPRGWSTSMQYLAYYGNSLGVYLGFHDPKASLKRFFVKAEANSIDFWSEVTIADKTKAANDWDFPGVFELDIFKGDWFDAAQIYKTWAESNADYWPEMDSKRRARQNKIGQIGIWTYYSADSDYPIAKIEKGMQDYISFFAGIPVGIHWYKWNYFDFDSKYPQYFPERSGMKELIARLQKKNALIMPYINGRLFDTGLANYKQEGYPYATKNGKMQEFTQDFNGNHFAVMCPSQKPWQKILIDAADRITGDLGSAGIYIDQVAAASPIECMDPSHGHSLGGGSWWHDGYRQMFAGIHQAIAKDKFVTVEGGNDYLANQVDGFLTEGWLNDNLVPAFQAVYSGRVQLFGTKTGASEYHKASYYAKLAQAFVNGIQPGRTSSWVVFDPNADMARPWLKQLATMRYKLRDFLAFGSLQRPLDLNQSIPKIVSTWQSHGRPIEVSISAIQSGVYKNKDNNAIAIIFANASMSQKIDFSFNFNASDYGFAAPLKLKTIGINDEEEEIVAGKFTKNLSLEPLTVLAYIIEQ